VLAILWAHHVFQVHCLIIKSSLLPLIKLQVVDHVDLKPSGKNTCTVQFNKLLCSISIAKSCYQEGSFTALIYIWFWHISMRVTSFPHVAWKLDTLAIKITHMLDDRKASVSLVILDDRKACVSLPSLGLLALFKFDLVLIRIYYLFYMCYSTFSDLNLRFHFFLPFTFNLSKSVSHWNWIKIINWLNNFPYYNICSIILLLLLWDASKRMCSCTTAFIFVMLKNPWWANCIVVEVSDLV
jgi:hypothetical protein